jgi:hypothetical protein
MKRFLSIVCLLHFTFLISSAQTGYWQQRVKYNMSLDVDVNTNRFTGKQTLQYTNNSPDTLKKVFYHVYWNAFQPNSMMDVRSQELGKKVINGRQDWDGRVRDRISNLLPGEIGYDSVMSLKMNGVAQRLKYHETILEVNLTKPILPKTTVTFELAFKAQVPVQIRRSGRDNAEGIRYSMSQWYPKMCEYDKEGWHPTPYIAREFYGVWGDYDITIKIDNSYKLGGTGVLQNATEIGWGYDKAGTELKNISTPKRSWHFIGNNVHDFVWTADPNYDHLVRKVGNTVLHVIYKHVDSMQSKWTTLADAAVIVLPYMEKRFGAYTYPQYSFIQGGDGGMEYPMATLLKGPGLGSAFHEWMHSWYQMMLGTNESMYPWMDEGFTSYAEAEVGAFYERYMHTDTSKTERLPLDHSGAYRAYFVLVLSKLMEPMTTHADHFNSNFAYSISSYYRGEIFIEQLGYIVGDQARDKILLEYYKRWRFKHPNADDFIKVAEDVSNIKLDWYKEYWVNTTKTIDYGIDSLWEENGVTKIRLKRVGDMPMPIDLNLTFKDGSKEIHYIPMSSMYGEKPAENNTPRVIHDEWRWTHPTYIIELKRRLTEITKVEIDQTRRMADIERKNNLLELNW